MNKTRQRMIETAAILFRREGIAAVGVARILKESAAPRGSLYYHFPGGKAEIAEAAARWAGWQVSLLIDRDFEQATSPKDGIDRFVDTITRLFEHSEHQDGCPVSSYLYGGNANASQLVSSIFAEWTSGISSHLTRLGLSSQAAGTTARRLLIQLQGAWIVGRAEASADAIQIVKMLQRDENLLND